ncbi:MAG: extracellular solute-binding protein [Verrucomicrobia bacterium]|nr:extracellular solute-binding protein [Verrucomicrobiota bacterium]
MLRRTLLASVTFAAAIGLAGTAWAEPVTIRLVSKDLLNSNPADVAHVERIEAAMAAQGTEINIEIVELPSSGYADALGIMLLSGDIPDLIYFQGGDAKMAEQGILEDLTPWIEGTTYLREALYPHNVERLANYPYLLYVFPPRAPQPVIRTDWLAATGLPAPETTDDYVALFQAIADGDMDGDGTANTFGITAAGSMAELDSIFNRAFGITGTWMQNDAGEWINSRVSTAERDKLAFYRSLFEAGLLDPEYITTAWDTKEDKFYTGRVGVILGSSAEVLDIYGGKMRAMHPDTQLTLLAPPAGPGGQGLQAVDVSKETRGFAISALSEHKEEVVALLDFMASPEGQLLDRMGFEGEHYTMNGDAYEVTDAMSTWYARFMAASNWTPPVQWKSDAASGSLERISADFVADSAFVFPAEFAVDLDAAENVYKSWTFRFISGDASMDDWDAYVAEWNAAGGANLTDHARTVLQ